MSILLLLLGLAEQYGPTALALAEKYGPVIEGWIKASHAAGTLEADLGRIGSQVGALIEDASSLADFADILASTAPEFGNPQVGQPDAPVGSSKR